MALKHADTLDLGTIDPGYRCDIRVGMFNPSPADYVIETGDRIAQLIVARYDAVEWAEGDELRESQRDAGLKRVCGTERGTNDRCTKTHGDSGHPAEADSAA